MSFHPWRRLREMAEWTLVFAPLPPGMRGRCHWPSKTITLRPGMTQSQRRTTLTHELEHVARGPVRVVYAEAEERRVDQQAARHLITLHALGEALAWSQDIHEVAEELWTTPRMVRVRLQHLHPSERHYLARRLDLTDGETA